MPNVMIEVPGYSKLSCSIIDDLLPSLLPDDTTRECTLARQVSSLCGCPIMLNSCSLCPDGSNVTQPDVQIVEFTDIFDGNVPTCQWVEAYLRSFHQSHEICNVSRERTSLKCGCANTTHSNSNAVPQNVSDGSQWGNFSNDDRQVNSSSSSEILKKLRDAKYFGAETEEDIHTIFGFSRSASILSTMSCVVVMVEYFRNNQQLKISTIKSLAQCRHLIFYTAFQWHLALCQ